MRFQVNDFYKLGKQTKSFINFLSDKQVQRDKNKDDYQFNNKFLNYKNAHEVVYEPHEKLCNYLAYRENINLHDEILKKLEANRIAKNNKLTKI